MNRITIILFTILISAGVTVLYSFSPGRDSLLSANNDNGAIIPEFHREVFSELNRTMNRVRFIINAESSRIFFRDEDGGLHDYFLEGGTLWHNQDVVLTGVQFLHFEYRDRYNNLLARVQRESDEIYSLSYTMKINVDGAARFARYRSLKSSNQLLLASTH